MILGADGNPQGGPLGPAIKLERAHILDPSDGTVGVIDHTAVSLLAFAPEAQVVLVRLNGSDQIDVVPVTFVPRMQWRRS